VKSVFPVLNPFSPNGLVTLSHSQFHYVFTNGLPLADSEAVYKHDCIPGSAHVLWQGALAGLQGHGDGEVDWHKKNRAPLLLIGGSSDHVVPPAVLEKYHHGGGVLVEYKEVEGRTHHIVGQEGWEEVADYSIQWVEGQLK
jgi:non-heme chloroperoxidase